SVSVRYHLIENANGVAAANNNQYQFTAKGRLKFDRRGKFVLHAGLFTGSTFNGGWNASGIGTGKDQNNLHFNQLYNEARPIKTIDIQAGGLYLTNCSSTEATGYDNDGYITGERIILNRPTRVYFDSVSITYGFVGDLRTPSVFRRFRRLGKSNYHQFLVTKSVNDRVSWSADYTFESGVDTLREAVKVRTPELRLLDAVLFENYQRLGRSSGYGFNAYGEKRFSKNFSLGVGFASID